MGFKMDFNGDLTVSGDSDTVVLSNVSKTAPSGDGGNNFDGVLTFGSGFKIQWATVSALPFGQVNTPDLVESYTGAQLFVMACYASPVTPVDESSITASLPDSPDTNDKVRFRGSANSLEAVTYISFGFDS